MSVGSSQQFCHDCGAKVNDEAFFCYKCGTNLATSRSSRTPIEEALTPSLIETEANKGKKVCSECGEVNSIFEAACIKCQKTSFIFPQAQSIDLEELVRPEDAYVEEPKYQPHGSKFGFGLMVLLVLIAASLFYVQNHKNDSSSLSTSPYGESGYSTDSSETLQSSDNQTADLSNKEQELGIETVNQGGSCLYEGDQKFKEGYSFTCVKAGRSISNLDGKKLKWKKSSVRKLEWATSTKSRVEVLNSLKLGYWKSASMSDIPEFDGEVFISSWPCKIYMANSYEAQIWVWNRQVNGEGYGGTWVPTDSQFWVINEPNYGPAKCATYFSLKYGGKRISQ